MRFQVKRNGTQVESGFVIHENVADYLENQLSQKPSIVRIQSHLYPLVI